MDSKTLKSMLRVNHAGEYGATRIYAGQQFVLGKKDQTIAHMAFQEAGHLKMFNELMIQHEVRPSILQPFWYVGGFAMGAVTALMSRQAAHACTMAVESVIDEHYQDQLATLAKQEDTVDLQKIKQVIEQCHGEELDHKEQAYNEGGRETKGFFLIDKVIKTITKTAIAVAKKF